MKINIFQTKISYFSFFINFETFAGVRMTPILRKSKEAAKFVVKSSKNPREPRPMNPRFMRSRGRGRKLFLTSRSRMASLARGRSYSSSDRRHPRDSHSRYPSWFNRDFSK